MGNVRGGDGGVGGQGALTFKFFVVVLNRCREIVALCCSYLFMVLDV